MTQNDHAGGDCQERLPAMAWVRSARSVRIGVCEVRYRATTLTTTQVAGSLVRRLRAIVAADRLIGDGFQSV
jgi:hypothetical protein